MALRRPRFRVYFNLDGDLVERDVTITHQDQLRAETEAVTQHGVTARIGDAPMLWTTLWCWYVLVREQQYAGDFRTFRLMDCQGYDALDDPRDPEAGEPVDPTAAGSGSASPSQPTTAADPATGSTQPSTSA